MMPLFVEASEISRLGIGVAVLDPGTPVEHAQSPMHPGGPRQDPTLRREAMLYASRRAERHAATPLAPTPMGALLPTICAGAGRARQGEFDQIART
jgi:hypothetical protein